MRVLDSDIDIDGLCSRLRRDQLSQVFFIERCIEVACCGLACTRAALWIFMGSQGARSMRCVRMYDRALGLRERMNNSSAPDADGFHDALSTAGHVATDDVHGHPATRALFQRVSLKRPVRSLIAAPFSINGELFGAFVCTQLDESVAWTPRQLFLLRRISVRATSAIASMAPREVARMTRNW